jgi:hypothetical protein
MRESRNQPAGYWLRCNYSPIGDGGDYPVISAHIRLSTTRIYSFQGWIGGAGE